MKITGTRLFYVLTAVLAGVALVPHPALAQATNGIGTALSNASTSVTKPSLQILSVASYITGATLVFWGLLRMKNWADGQSNLGDGLWRIIGGSLMVALPFTADTIVNSIFGNWGGAGSSSSGGLNRIGTLQGNYSTNGAWIGLDQAMVNFVVDVYGPGKALTAGLAWIIGAACLMTGVYRLAQSGQAAQGKGPSTKGTVGYIVGGALMLATGNIMDTISTTLFGGATTSNFSSLYYAVPGATNQTAVNNVVQALFAFVEVIGWIAFLRGMYLLVKLAQGGGEKTHAHAFTHIIFGACAVNMYAVVSMLQTTLGMKLVN